MTALLLSHRDVFSGEEFTLVRIPGKCELSLLPNNKLLAVSNTKYEIWDIKNRVKISEHSLGDQLGLGGMVGISGKFVMLCLAERSKGIVSFSYLITLPD